MVKSGKLALGRCILASFIYLFIFFKGLGRFHGVLILQCFILHIQGFKEHISFFFFTFYDGVISL